MPGSLGNWNRDPHFSNVSPDTFALTFADSVFPFLSGECGDLAFDNRVRSFTARYRPNVIGDGDWRYWWRRGRRALDLPSVLDSVSKKNRAIGVPDTVTVQMPLLTAYDGLGAMFLMAPADTLVLSEAAFTDPNLYGALQHIAVQHWARSLEPILNSATVSGMTVTLQWTNRHRGRPIDSTMVFRDGAERALRPGTATSYTDTVPASGTYTYTLKHVTPPLVVFGEDPLVEPNSAQSSAVSVTIGEPPTVPPALQVGWTGPSVIRKNASCTWIGSVTGGTSPWTLRWTKDGVLVSSTNKWQGGSGANFLLRFTVTSGDGQVQYYDELITVSPSGPLCGPLGPEPEP